MKKAPRQKSEYGKQLAEKQELRNTYALRERQFRKYFDMGNDPDSIIALLEMRLDNVVYRSGFAPTINAARQMVSHGHIQLNGKNVDIPSIQVKINDIINFHPGSVSKETVKNLPDVLKKYEGPAWISLDKKNISAKVVERPSVADPMIISRIRPIIEFYSR